MGQGWPQDSQLNNVKLCWCCVSRENYNWFDLCCTGQATCHGWRYSTCTYLQALSYKKHVIVCGTEFGCENVGQVALICQALYGGKVAGRDFWHHLRKCMGQLGFTPSRANPDVWFRLSTQSTGGEYYEYVLLYFENVLVISEKAKSVLWKEIGKYWVLKE